MLLSFIVAAIAGALTPVIEPHLAKILGKAMPDGKVLAPREERVIAFGVMLILASIVLALLGANSSVFWAALGGVLGACAVRIVAMLRAGGEGA